MARLNEQWMQADPLTFAKRFFRHPHLPMSEVQQKFMALILEWEEGCGRTNVCDSRNLGRFKLPEDEVRHDTDCIIEIFRILGILPVRCELRFDTRELEYLAISPHFGKIEEGMVAPEYDIQAKADERGVIISAKAVRI